MVPWILEKFILLPCRRVCLCDCHLLRDANIVTLAGVKLSGLDSGKGLYGKLVTRNQSLESHLGATGSGFK